MNTEESYNISPEFKTRPSGTVEVDFAAQTASILEERENIWFKNEIYTHWYNTVDYIKENYPEICNEFIFVSCPIPEKYEMNEFLNFILKNIKQDINAKKDKDKDKELISSFNSEYERIFKPKLSDYEREDIFYMLFDILSKYNRFIYVYLPKFDHYKNEIKKKEISIIKRITQKRNYQVALIVSTGYIFKNSYDTDFDEIFLKRLPLERNSLTETELEQYYDDISGEIPYINDDESFKDTSELFFGNHACLWENFKSEFNNLVRYDNDIEPTSIFKRFIERKLNMKKLSKEQFKEFQRLLMEIYRTSEELAIFVRLALNENINVFAGSNDLQTKTYQLIEWAEAKGRVINLIEEFQEQNKDNKAIDKLISSIKEQEPVMKDNENNRVGDSADDTKILELRKQYLELSGKTDIKFNPKDELEEVKNKIKYLTK